MKNKQTNKLKPNQIAQLPELYLNQNIYRGLYTVHITAVHLSETNQTHAATGLAGISVHK